MRWGAVALGRLTPARVDAAIARWIREGSGPAVVLGRYRLLHSAITWAMHEQYLRSDPLAGHRAPRAPLPRKHLRPALGRRLIEEAERLAEKAGAAFGERPGSRRLLLAAFRAAQTALLVRLVADTGARLGELAAMQVGDLEDGRLTIERAAKGRGVIGPTKTHRRRTITLGPAVATRWVAHVDTWRPDAAAASWLFTSAPESDQALGLSGMTLRFRRVRTIAGVTDATMHRLRHTVGTHLVRSGDLLDAKARLGHDNLSTTLRNYSMTTASTTERLRRSSTACTTTNHLDWRTSGEPALSDRPRRVTTGDSTVSYFALKKADDAGGGPP